MSLTQEQKQDFFNRAVAGLASQGFERALGENGKCAYRGKDGKKCAVGHLLSDDKYFPEMEGGRTTAFVALTGQRDLGYWHEDWQFLERLQGCHDFCEQSPDVMKSRLRAFGKDNDLEIPEVLQ